MINIGNIPITGGLYGIKEKTTNEYFINEQGEECDYINKEHYYVNVKITHNDFIIETNYNTTNMIFDMENNLCIINITYINEKCTINS